MSNLTYAQAIAAVAENGGNKSEAARKLGVTRNKLRYALGGASSQKKTKVVKEALTIEEEHRLKKENSKLKAELRKTLDGGEVDSALADLIRETTKFSGPAPKQWLQPKLSKKGDRGIICAALSDLHLDEVVHPDQIGYVNGYNRKIATQRLHNFFENLIRISRDFINGIKIEGLELMMLGDMVSGNIHEELKESNECPITETLRYWSIELSRGLTLLAEHFSWIHVACVVGNHGRLTHKPRAKFRAMDNFDWLLYHMVAQQTAHLGSVKFTIPTSADNFVQIYSTRYLLTHGDQFRGGTGIAGMLSPLLLGDARKRKRQVAIGQPYDYMVMGHWHQYAMAKSLIINGSLKGYDEYAYQSNFDFEPPQQAFWVTDPKHGKTISAPIRCKSKSEGWEE